MGGGKEQINSAGTPPTPRAPRHHCFSARGYVPHAHTRKKGHQPSASYAPIYQGFGVGVLWDKTVTGHHRFRLHKNCACKPKPTTRPRTTPRRNRRQPASCQCFLGEALPIPDTTQFREKRTGGRPSLFAFDRQTRPPVGHTKTRKISENMCRVLRLLYAQCLGR